MNEALTQKAANVEMLSFLSNQVQDRRLQNMLQQQAQTIYNHYNQGVQILQGLSANQSVNRTYQQVMNVQPKLGLRNPSVPSPNLQAQIPSERSICTISLSLHKFGTIGWSTLALECTNPQLRTYLMNGASMCDKMAYEVWSFMNQKGYYQVPTLQENTTQTMIQAYQVPQNNPMTQGMNNYQQFQQYQQ